VSDPSRSEELHRQYDRALAEYRFQVDLNWRRSEYFFVLNVGVLVAAATMFSSEDVPRLLVALLFLIGTLLAVLSVMANEAQHSYYKATRALKKEMEKEMALEKLAIATTPGMGSSLKRIGRVRTFLKIMLIAIALVDLGGAGFAAADLFDEGDAAPEPARTVLVQVISTDRHTTWLGLVVSRNGAAVESRRLKPHLKRMLLELRPGRYLLSVGGSGLCQRKIEVDRRPLQLLTLRC
jgi:hypothetical protein